MRHDGMPHSSDEHALVEIRAAEGGRDAKDLVELQASLFVAWGRRSGL